MITEINVTDDSVVFRRRYGVTIKVNYTGVSDSNIKTFEVQMPRATSNLDEKLMSSPKNRKVSSSTFAVHD